LKPEYDHLIKRHQSALQHHVGAAKKITPSHIVNFWARALIDMPPLFLLLDEPIKEYLQSRGEGEDM
jgi:hypothetical protein